MSRVNYVGKAGSGLRGSGKELGVCKDLEEDKDDQNAVSKGENNRRCDWRSQTIQNFACIIIIWHSIPRTMESHLNTLRWVVPRSEFYYLKKCLWRQSEEHNIGRQE